MTISNYLSFSPFINQKQLTSNSYADPKSSITPIETPTNENLCSHFDKTPQKSPLDQSTSNFPNQKNNKIHLLLRPISRTSEFLIENMAEKGISTLLRLALKIESKHLDQRLSYAALRLIATPNGLQTFQTLTRHSTPSLRILDATGLCYIASKSEPWVQGSTKKIQPQTAFTPSGTIGMQNLSFGKKAFQSLMPLIQSGDKDILKVMANSLGFIRSDTSVKLLELLLEEPYLEVHLAAIRSLGYIGNEDAKKQLQELTRSTKRINKSIKIFNTIMKAYCAIPDTFSHPETVIKSKQLSSLAKESVIIQIWGLWEKRNAAKKISLAAIEALCTTISS